jgi:hypothetical protein
MKRISKDLADKMVMDVLISLSKQNNASIGFAQNSIDIMNDVVDNTVFTGILLTKARPSFFDEKEVDMKITIVSALKTIFQVSKKQKDVVFNNDLSKEMSKLDDDDYSISTKLDFALYQFVNAYYEYERLEKKYPELMKVM